MASVWKAMALLAVAAAEQTMREALLAEAKHRQNDWFLNKEWGGTPPNGRLDWPKEEFGIQLQITTGEYFCDAEGKIAKYQEGGDVQPEHIPITFGRFDVEDADPIDVFNVLADILAQEEWDELLQGGPGVTILGDFTNEYARAAAVTFVARPFPDRQVFQWQVYNATRDWKDMWVAFSTRRNDELYKLHDMEAWPAVQAQNCLGAYHVVALPQGGCHVVFTTMVNSHPPWPITAKFVFNLLWTKTVGYIQALRDRAKFLKKQRLASGTPAKPIIPDWLLYDGVSPNATASGKFWHPDAPKTNPPFSGPDYVVDIIQASELEKLKKFVTDGSHLPVMLFGLACLVVGSFAAYKRVRRKGAQSAEVDVLEEGILSEKSPVE